MLKCQNFPWDGYSKLHSNTRVEINVAELQWISCGVTHFATADLFYWVGDTRLPLSCTRTRGNVFFLLRDSLGSITGTALTSASHRVMSKPKCVCLKDRLSHVLAERCGALEINWN